MITSRDMVKWRNILFRNDMIGGWLYSQWKTTLTSIFKWEGLPDDDLEWYIEKILFENGRIVFFQDSDGVFKALPPTDSGIGLNIYGKAVSWGVTGVNFTKQGLGIENSVMIKNDKFSGTNSYYVNYVCGVLRNIDETILISSNHLKSPFIMSGDEKRLLTMKNEFKKITGNEMVIYKDSKSEFDSDLKVHDTSSNYHGEELMQLYSKYENRILRLYGLKYLEIEKKERVVVDEVKSNEDHISVNLHSLLDERRKAVKKINEMFGLNVSVNINPEMMVKVEEKEEMEDDGKEDSKDEV